MNEHFFQGFVKAASKSNPEGHHIRRALLGNTISSAIEAKKGKKAEAAVDAYTHGINSTFKGMGRGASIGPGLGGLAGVGAAIAKKDPSLALHGLAHGAIAGAGLGTIAGAIKGNHGSEASKIHGQYSKDKK
jgi:hypothetical protein